MPSRHAVFTVALCLTVWPAGPRAQPPARFRTTTVATELEVTVTDASGAAVTDLTAADLTVTEDDVAQEIVSVEYVGGAAALTASSPSDAASTGEIERSNIGLRSTKPWVLLVDDRRVAGVLRDHVKAALQAFVEQLPEGTPIALVPTSGDARAAQEFTTDRTLLRSRIERLRFTHPIDDSAAPPVVVTPSGPDLVRQAALDHLISSLGKTALMLGRAGARHAAILLVSHGLPLRMHEDARDALAAANGPALSGSVFSSGGGDDVQQRVAALAEAVTKAQRAGVVVHVLDPTAFRRDHLERATRAERAYRHSSVMATWDDPSAAMQVVARHTGGLYVRETSPAAAASAVLARIRATYRVRYMPTTDDHGERLRRVRVSVSRPGTSSTAPIAYARSADARFDEQRRSAPPGAAVAAALPDASLPIRVRMRPLDDVARGVELRVQLLDLPDGLSADGERIEVLAVAVNRRGASAAKAGGEHLLSSHHTGWLASPLRLVPLKPGTYQIRVAARSVARDRVGSVFLEAIVEKER